MSVALQLRPISDLLKYKFFIPSYQRGYRWTELEVTDLLDDIYQFMNESEGSKKEVFYCLQPVVVYRKDDQYVLIDGQQRLTTIYLILTQLSTFLTLLKKPKFTLEYATRTGSAAFLDNIDFEKSNDNVDFYHIYQAFKAIEKWFEDKDGAVQFDVVKTLCSDDTIGKNVKVIWYEINPQEAINIFTRINIGKVPLTNAELIKALFLQRNNFKNDYELKQIQIATEWDLIEKRLQNDAFWYFIHSSLSEEKYENRIEYVFDLVKKNDGEQEALYTFHQFNNQFEKDKKSRGQIDVNKHWLEIKQYFSILEQWYENNELYHYIGFLIEYKYPVFKLIEYSTSLDKDQFLEKIKSEIKSQFVDVELETLDFNSAKDKFIIKKALLLFNLETLLTTQKAVVRFPFDKYKMENWDIEHVTSQTQYQTDKRNYKKWANDLLDFFVGISYTDERWSENEHDSIKIKILETAETLPETHQNFTKALCEILEDHTFNESKVNHLSEGLYKEFKENDITDKNGIANLALLDEKTNRGYKNAMFPIKRKWIIENDRNGLFVPICTKNMFLKYYSSQMSEVMYWQKKDSNDYLRNLKQTLSDYITNKSEA